MVDRREYGSTALHFFKKDLTGVEDLSVLTPRQILDVRRMAPLIALKPVLRLRRANRGTGSAQDVRSGMITCAASSAEPQSGAV